ncbi:MAG: hypothetical protein HC936_14240 [Leptolyngbyaceae cyanobacterium SU_3_3]|nr:hypothetical protein [Leptolyngbyaceae cyanobacterium SU_3_3]
MALKEKRKFARMIALTLSFLLAIGLSQALAASNPPSAYEWKLPANLPKPVVPADNPMTPEKVELGRHLFYEKRLSITGNYSCASCHEQNAPLPMANPLALVQRERGTPATP